MKKYRSIFISDVHLGAKFCKAEHLNSFLNNNTCEKLYLVGDIIDGWKVYKNKWRWNKKQTKLVEKLLKISRDGTDIVYILGNHDEFLRPLVNKHVGFYGIEIHNHYIHVGVDGLKYIVIHGDLFDGISRIGKWISLLGDTGYDFVLSVNNWYNFIRYKLGFKYWSLSKFLKHKVKRAVDFMFEYEKNLASYCKRKGYDGIICGHIHHAEIRKIDGIIYMNDGDWVESCTALVEHYDGKFEIIIWENACDEALSNSNRCVATTDKWCSDDNDGNHSNTTESWLEDICDSSSSVQTPTTTRVPSDRLSIKSLET